MTPELRAWRKDERARLIRERLAIPAAERRAMSRRIAETLDQAIGPLAGRTVGAYWPIRGEPDLRPFLESLTDRRGHAALPVVVAPGKALVFRRWASGEPLEPGVWNIPVPKESAQPVMPQVVIAPVVGFDPACYRLGYGGGFFDRTLAAMAARPLVLGVGYGHQAMPTIRPQPHDIPMDAVITEDGILRPGDGTA